MKKIDKISIALFIGLTGALVGNSISANNRFKNVDENLYRKTFLGVPVVANLGIDKTLDVVIDESFTNEQKSHIAQAIRDLDMDLTGVKYNILLNSDKAGIKCINITNNKSDLVSSVGKTNSAYNLFSGTIMFPVEIEVYTKAFDYYYNDSNFSSRYFSTMIKHEMLHVLGLKDIYDQAYIDKSIMFGNLDEKNRLYDLSPLDIYTVNNIYKSSNDKDKQNIKTTINDPVYILPSKLEDEQTL